MRDYVTFFELGRTHKDTALDVVRIFLGIALFIRGILFVSDSTRVMELVAMSHTDYLLPSLMLYAAILAHLMGGLMLAAGLLTRFAALIQIPVLLGAVFIALLQGGLFLPSQSLELSALVLFLLIIFFVFGSGRWSVNYLIFTPGHAKAAEDRDHRHAEEHRAKVTSWALMRQQTQAEQRLAAAAEAGSQKAGQSAEQFHNQNVARLMRVVRYTIVFVVAAVLLFLGLRAIPYEVSAGELGAIAGMLILILGVFFIFYSVALRDSDTSEE